MPLHKTPPKIEILLQIYRGTTKEFQRDITFQLYQDLLGYGVVSWQKSNIGKEEVDRTPTPGLGPLRGVREADTPLDRKNREERKLTLKSSATNSKLEAITQMVSTKRMSAIIRKGEIEWGYVFTLAKGGPTLHSREAKEQLFEIQRILGQYLNVFEDMPKGLSPSRGLEYTMELETRAKPVMVPPYRHLKAYKDEIERTSKELLDMGFIWPSSNPFASLVVLVTKKDGTIRMCIDYRLLNKKTIKNIYPILKVDDLIDELHGAKYFSKIDLRSGYHQIRMKKENIHKTTFKCHYGHFEFFVMPFRLTNASATFQSTMNQVFKK